MAGSSGLARALGSALVRAWLHRGPLAFLVMPVAWSYALLSGARRSAYRLGWLRPGRVPCAVVVVGNVVAGGAGKTPTTIGVVSHLRARGLRVGVVSRGYGRNSDSVRMVRTGDDPADAGDEPLLMARATGVPVCVGRNRPAAARALLAAHPETQVIVCDDGLQHYALYRDVEVCVFDDRGVGNGWPLPAGPLREPWPRTTIAALGQDAARSLVLHTGQKPAFAGFTATRALAPVALAQSGHAVPLEALQAPVLALAGIATPEAFFASLRLAGVTVDKTLALPDHFDFAQLDTGQLRGYQVVCTEKDAVKLWKVWPQALAVPLVQTMEPAFFVSLDRMVDRALRAQLSSRHGHQTT